MADNPLITPRLLDDLIALLDAREVLPGKTAGIVIDSVSADSRKMKPGSIFVACEGNQVDGHLYIPDAVRRGASAVIGTREIAGLPAPYVRVDESRTALARIAAALYDFPARKLTVIGITGTDGKTTTTNLLYHILRAAGVRTGMISTVNAVIGDQVLDTGFHVTTPDAEDVQRYLAMMADSGMTHVILESTSHGLAQHRVDACEFDLAVVTNITHEHLDYHGSYPAYRSAKGRLFSMLQETASKPFCPNKLAVLNRDDASYEYLHQISGNAQISYGFHEAAEVRGVDHRSGIDGNTLLVRGRDQAFTLHSPLIGGYNAANMLAAATAAVWGLGIAAADVQQGIESLKAIPGRMERIDLGQEFTAIVDFAHSPNALRVALTAARPLTDGSVIAVFGSAGLRDREKRRLMAENSLRLADVTILTAEDPRSESITAILDEMAQGARSEGGEEGRNFWRIADRREAIRFALKLAHPGDLVISCGKGHEQSMCFGSVEYLWDDRTAMRAALAEYLNLPGPEMPFLPDWE